MKQYNEDGTSFEKNGSKKPFIERIFKLPYDTLDVYKKLKKNRNRTNDSINNVNN